MPPGVELDVRRLEIAVDDALFVGVLERLGDLARDCQGLVERYPALLHALGERRTFDQLEDQGARLAGLFDAVDRGDVRMVEARQHLRLALEAREALRVGREGLGQDLDRHLASELRVRGAIDLSHAADAELGGDPIAADVGADQPAETILIRRGGCSHPSLNRKPGVAKR